jgi:guanylate kinase
MNLLKNGKNLGTAIIVSGPSGAGKSSICGLVRREMTDIRFSISCTTRSPRPGESHGKDYYFIGHEEFKTRIGSGEFVEYAEVFSNYYGTLKSEVVEHVTRGEDVFLDIDIQGAMQIREAAKADPLLARCVEFIFVAPPSLDELERRLRNRQSDSEEQIRQRLAKAAYEISFWKKYDYLLINAQLEDSAREMMALIRTLRAATKRMPEDLFNV